jgi:serine/threonine-protein kinase
LDERHDQPESFDPPRSAGFASESGGRSGPPGAERACPSCGATYGVDDIFCRVDGTRLLTARTKEQGRIGEVVDGRYTILGELGEGAMGTVYRALQRGLEREVAVKILRRGNTNERTSARRFLREVKAVSRLNHGNIVTVYDFGETVGGELFLAMELLRGVTLRQFMDDQGPQPAERVVALAGEICDGLHCAHAKGIIHRDLKPSNVVVVDADDVSPRHVKLLDFGLAKWSDGEFSEPSLTRTGHICGTPLYMSPEQALGMDLDGRSDVYAVGLLVYELLVGRQPFSERPIVDILRAHVQEEPPPFAVANAAIRVDAALEAVVLRALAKDASERPSSALELKRELEEALAVARQAACAATLSLAGDGTPATPTASVLPAVNASPAADAVAAPALLRPPTAPPAQLAAAVIASGAAAGAAAAAARPTERDEPLALVRPPSRPPAPRASSLAARTERTPQPPPRGAAVLRQRPAGASGSSPGGGATEPPALDFQRPTRRDMQPERVLPPDEAAVLRRPTAIEGRADRPGGPRRGSTGEQPLFAAGSGRGAQRGSGSAPGLPRGAVEPPSDVDAQADAAERALDVVGDGPRRPWCELNLAELRRRQGRLDEATAHARVAARLLRKTGDVRLEGRATTLLADLAEQAGDQALACDWLQLAVQSWRAAGNAERVVEALSRMAGLLYRRQHYAKARTALEAAVKLDTQLERPERLAANLRGLGAVREALGDGPGAFSAVRRALDLEERRGDADAQALCHHHLGRLAEDRAEWGEALARHEKALALRRGHGDERSVARSLQHAAVCLVQLERYAEAERRLDEARGIQEARRDEGARAIVLRLLGDVRRRRGDWAGAARHYEVSEEILGRLGSPLRGGRAAFLASLGPGAEAGALQGALAGAE